MKLRALQRADWFIGLALAVFLAPITRIVGTILRRDHSFEHIDTIVVMKLLGGGNFALAMPMLLGLRQSFPQSKLIAVTTPSTIDFAKSIGVFDSVRLIDTKSLGSLLSSALLTLISIFRVDVIFDLEAHSKLSTCFGLFSCARNRLGFFTNDFFLREYLYTHLVFFNLRASRPLLFERLAAIVGSQCASYEDCDAHLKSLLGVRAHSTPSVAVGVGCSDLGRVRQLNAEQWVAVLSKEPRITEGAQVFFLGSRADYGLSEEVAKRLRDVIPDLHLHNLCGSKSLSESLRILGGCASFYTIDSGLLHFARLMKVPAMSFWGPTDPTTRLVSIKGYQETIRYRPLICSPCIHVAENPPCRGRNLCISSLFQDEPVSDSEALANITISPVDRADRQPT